MVGLALAQASGACGAEKPIKELILPGKAFLLEGRPAFIFLPPQDKRKRPQPWVMYAPTLPGLPDVAEKWMHQQFLAAGIAVAGIDSGESYGSPHGQQKMTALYNELTQHYDFSTTPVLLGRSRGGLFTLSWAIANPTKVAGLAGIYPVYDLRSYPGLVRAATAYDLSTAELENQLATYNPIAQGAVLAQQRIPVCIIHGDHDAVVPLEHNSQALEVIYQSRQASDAFQLIIAKDQGHSYWPGFFRCQALIQFVQEHAP
ncbi:MAG: prolyl oligopeptidase family serine peptidase [Pirellulaceae bacterium]|nr:prolyl oligopeptidase family serine peptidase [Pirellulaceae bacterium]